MGCALLISAAALAPGILLLRAGWTWTGWAALAVGLWIAGGALYAWWRDGGRRRNPWSG
jgi:hypothetical protein